MTNPFRLPGYLLIAAVACACALAMPAIAQSEHGKLTVLPPDFKTFIAAKEQQARSLAGNLSRELPPEVAGFYQAALAGDWKQASNANASVARHLESNPGGENAAVLHAVGHPMWETYIALKFSVKEGFPLDWMYPHLEPHGLIMKLNREPLKQLSPEAVKRDQEFWSHYMKPMVDDWLKEETTVADVCAFIDQVFVRKDLKGFAGDPDYAGDPYACKAFSRLRTSIAGVYRWRAVKAKDGVERRRMKRAADFAFRQALALCPYSREAVSRYARALANDCRIDDSRRVAGVAAKFPETKSQAAKLIRELEPDK